MVVSEQKVRSICFPIKTPSADVYRAFPLRLWRGREGGKGRAPPLPVSNARLRHLQRRDRPSRSLRRRGGHSSSRVDREDIVLTSAAACSNPPRPSNI